MKKLITGFFAFISFLGTANAQAVLPTTWGFNNTNLPVGWTEVNVAPAPPAEYVNPPADVSVDCANVSSDSTLLNYNNGEAGVCLISGVSTAVVSGSFDACGGSLIYTWSFVTLIIS